MNSRPAPPNDADIEQALRASRTLEDAPETVIQRAIGVWQHGARAAAPAPGPLRRLLARLASDSGEAGSALAFGQRGGGAPVRQIVFCAEGFDVDLRVVADRAVAVEQWRLSGQVLGPQVAGTVALRDGAGRALAEVPLDELGEFRLPPLGRGTYALTLQVDGVQIELPAIALPSSSASAGAPLA